jgi:hypothetical protein
MPDTTHGQGNKSQRKPITGVVVFWAGQAVDNRVPIVVTLRGKEPNLLKVFDF